MTIEDMSSAFPSDIRIERLSRDERKTLNAAKTGQEKREAENWIAHNHHCREAPQNSSIKGGYITITTADQGSTSVIGSCSSSYCSATFAFPRRSRSAPTSCLAAAR